MIILPFLAAAILCSQGQELRDINNSFAADVYKELTKTKAGNFITCPLSAHIILSLALTGAKGNTAKQLSAGLHLPNDLSKIRDVFKKLTTTLNTNQSYIFTTANKICVSNKYRLENEFKQIATDVFRAETDVVDFNRREKVVNDINEWVEKNTHNKIKYLIKNEHIDPNNTVALLINALYFKSDWETPFSPHHTSPSKFYLDRNNEVNVDMMWMKDNQNYYENKDLDAKFLELPFGGGDVTMTFVLPNDIEGLAALETRISEVLVRQPYQEEDIILTIPKFKMETDIKFNDILRNLGVVEAFTESADFSGVSKTSPPIRISEVVQKAFLEINEQGATAAASTRLGFVQVSLNRYYFNADRPFIFYLKHKVSGVFFIGRFVAPTDNE